MKTQISEYITPLLRILQGVHAHPLAIQSPMISPHQVSAFLKCYTNCFLNGLHTFPPLISLLCSLLQEILLFLSLYYFLFLSVKTIYVNLFKLAHIIHPKVLTFPLCLSNFQVDLTLYPNILFLLCL